MAKKYKSDRVDWKHVWSVKNLLHIIAGVLLAVLAMKGFMIPNRFLDGGVTGISILLHEMFHINISILVIVLNLIFIYLGYRKIGKTLRFKPLSQSSFFLLGSSLLIYPPSQMKSY